MLGAGAFLSSCRRQVSAASRLGLVTDQGCLKFHGPEHRRPGPAPTEGFLSPSTVEQAWSLQCLGPGVSVHPAACTSVRLHFEPENQQHLTACITSMDVSCSTLSFLTGQMQRRRARPRMSKSPRATSQLCCSGCSAVDEALFTSEPRLLPLPCVGERAMAHHGTGGAGGERGDL